MHVVGATDGAADGAAVVGNSEGAADGGAVVGDRDGTAVVGVVVGSAVVGTAVVGVAEGTGEGADVAAAQVQHVPGQSKRTERVPVPEP